MKNIKQTEKSPVKCRMNILVTILLVLTVTFCVYVVVQVLSQGYANLGGYSMFRVVTGSMEPTIKVGALLVTEQVEMNSIVSGDIICFRAQESAIFGKMMTHRVVGVHTAIDGSLFFETKGDANLVQDGYLVTQTNFVGKVIWHTGESNMLSSVFSFFSNKIGFLACIVLPCFLLAGIILKDSVRSIRNELENVVEELEVEEYEDPRYGMTQEEYDEMYARIRAELIEELTHYAGNQNQQ